LDELVSQPISFRLNQNFGWPAMPDVSGAIIIAASWRRDDRDRRLAAATPRT